ncbi:MAG: InlB B-repeat-containing protein [Lachnospiraceae bacterium]|nr:InlB B-repeat-containing protein [Lachnospiraceae bacterium]
MNERKLLTKAVSCILFCVALFLCLPLFRITAKAGGTEYGIWVGDTQFTDTCLEIKDAEGKGTATYDDTNKTVTFDNFNGVENLHEVGMSKYQFYTALNITIKGKATFADFEDDGSKIRQYYELGTAFGGDAGVTSIKFDKSADIRIRTYGYGINFPGAAMTVNGKLDIKTDGETHRYAIQCNEYIDSADAEVTAVTTKICSDALRINAEAKIYGTLNARAEYDKAKKDDEGSAAIFVNTASPYTGITFYNGCKVTAFTGKYGTAVFSNEQLIIYNCDIDAEGGKAAFATANGGITKNPEAYIKFPENAQLADGGKGFVDGQGSPAAKVIVKYVDWYDLWIGEYRINSEIKDNIPGIIGGSASYDPIENVLTFSGNVTGIDGICDYSSLELICVKTDLTIRGNAQLITSDADYGIYVEGLRSLTIDGNLTVKGAEMGLYGDDVALTINGKLTAGAYNYYPLYVENLIIGRNGVLDASVVGSSGYAIYVDGSLTLNGGTVTASANGKDSYAIYTGSLTVNAGSLSASAEGVNACGISGYIYIYGGQVTTESSLNSSRAYDGTLYMYDGTFAASSAGMNAGAMKGEIYQYGGKITTVADGKGAFAQSGYLRMQGGNMEAEAKNANQDDDYVMYPDCMELYAGSLTVKASGSGIKCGGYLYNNGATVNVSAQKERGIYVNYTGSSAVDITAGTIKATGRDYGFYSEGKARISGGTLTAEGGKAAVYVAKKDADSIDLKEDAKITAPANGKFYASVSPEYTTVVAGETTTPTQSVTIQGTGVYQVWVGKHQVTDKNKGNIDGVEGGKASYDPATGTLTFTGDGSGVVDGVDGEYNSSLIYADCSLIIKGKAKLVAGDYGIYVTNSLTIEGDITAKSSNQYAVFANTLKVPGTLNASSVKEIGVYVSNMLTVPKAGQLTAASQASEGLYVYSNAVIEGTVTAEGKSTGLYIYGNQDTAISGTLNVKGENYGLYYEDNGNIFVSGTLNAKESGYGIYMNGKGDLRVSGAVTAEGSNMGIYLDGTGGTLDITGTLDAKATDYAAIWVDEGGIIFHGERLSAYSEKDTALYCLLDLNVLSGTLDAQTDDVSEAAMYINNGVFIGEDMRITLPVGGKLSSDGRQVVEADGVKKALHAKIEHIPVYKVTFQTNGHGKAPQTQSVNTGKKAEKPADPSETCHTFGGWFTDAACTAAYNFDAAVTKDITLYAKWTPAHSLSAVPAKEAAEGVAGNSAYYVCSSCGKYFSDAAGTKEIAKDSWVIAAKPAGQGQAGQGQTGQNQTETGKSDKENSPYKDLPDITQVSVPVKGQKYTDEASGSVYQATKSGKNIELIYAATISKDATGVTIPATVKIGNKSYKVTQIAANAFKGCKKLTKVTIGKNIKKIGKKAFYGCSKLKKITIKTTSLTKKNVGANAFKGIHAKAQAKVPKKKVSAYKKVLKAKGMNGKKQTISK